MSNLMESIARCQENRDKYAYGSENWLYYNRDLERMRDLLAQEETDERYAYREWPSGGGAQ